MVEHKAHSISVPVESGDAAPAGRYQIIDVLAQYIGQHGTFQVSPKPFNQVQARAVWRQPEHGDLIRVSLQPGLDRLGMMKPTVVADQTNLTARVGGHQCDQKCQEFCAALFVGHRVGDLARGEIHSAVDDFLLILARSGDFGLCPDRRPHPGQDGMTMDFDLVLKDQRFGGIGFQRFFFKRTSCFPAFS